MNLHGAKKPRADTFAIIYLKLIKKFTVLRLTIAMSRRKAMQSNIQGIFIAAHLQPFNYIDQFYQNASDFNFDSNVVKGNNYLGITYTGSSTAVKSEATRHAMRQKKCM